MKPTTVSILGVTYNVAHPNKVDAENSFGECNGPGRMIRIRKSLEGEGFEMCLLHEILHAIIYTSGQSEHLTPEQEEGLVVALENGLTALYERKHSENTLPTDS